MNMHEVDLGVLWASETLKGKRKMQNWAEGEAEQQCILSGSLSQPMGSSEAGVILQNHFGLGKGAGPS